MNKAIEKILNNFVIGDTDISYYHIHGYPTPEKNVSYYEVEIYLSLDTPPVESEAILDRLETSFIMLGFETVSGNFFHDEDRDKLLIRVTGYIKEVEDK